VGWVPDISSEVVARALAVIETGAIGDVALAVIGEERAPSVHFVVGIGRRQCRTALRKKGASTLSRAGSTD